MDSIVISVIKCKKYLHIFTALLLITASLLLMFFSHQLIAAISPQALHGVETRFQFDRSTIAPEMQTQQPVILTALFRACATTCPANINVLRQFKNNFQADMSYLFITLQPQQDSLASLQSYLKAFSPDLFIHRPADDNALQKVMNSLPESFSAIDKDGQHAGYIYLSHPSARGLIAYISPTYQQIINDLNTLQQRGK